MDRFAEREGLLSASLVGAVTILATGLAVASTGLVGSRQAAPSGRVAPAVVDLAPTPDGPVLTRATWAVENEAATHTWTEAEALDHARAFDVLTALPDAYRDHVAAMKAANPDLLLLVYLNGTFAFRTLGDTYPDDWYARDANGARIRSRGYGNWLMDPRHPGWVDDRVATCRELLERSGYDGCFIDVLTDAPLDPAYVTAVPIDARTGKAWTRAGWLDATASIAAAIRDGVDPAPVYGNAVGSGQRYFRQVAPTSRLLDVLDGAIAEGWIRTATQPLDEWRGEPAWRADVDMLVDAAQRGVPVLVIVKTWNGASTTEASHVRDFALASFLLGTDGSHRFAFSGARGAPPTPVPWPNDLGAPLGPYEEDGGVYRRTFTGGTVLVNPGDASRKGGGTTLPPHSARIVPVTAGG